jgi:hypothetical protein
MNYGQKLKLGDSHVTSVKAWGCPDALLLHRQKSGHLSRHYIFIASYSMHFSWSVFTFAFSFYFFCLLQ